MHTQNILESAFRQEFILDNRQWSFQLQNNERFHRCDSDNSERERKREVETKVRFLHFEVWHHLCSSLILVLSLWLFCGFWSFVSDAFNCQHSSEKTKTWPTLGCLVFGSLSSRVWCQFTLRSSPVLERWKLIIVLMMKRMSCVFLVGFSHISISKQNASLSLFRILSPILSFYAFQMLLPFNYTWKTLNWIFKINSQQIFKPKTKIQALENVLSFSGLLRKAYKNTENPHGSSDVIANLPSKFIKEMIRQWDIEWEMHFKSWGCKTVWCFAQSEIQIFHKTCSLLPDDELHCSWRNAYTHTHTDRQTYIEWMSEQILFGCK